MKRKKKDSLFLQMLFSGNVSSEGKLFAWTVVTSGLALILSIIAILK